MWNMKLFKPEITINVLRDDKKIEGKEIWIYFVLSPFLQKIYFSLTKNPALTEEIRIFSF